MKTCSNCKASVPDDKMGTGPNGRPICCAHCAFNPLGCRCKYGEYGVEETYRDPEFPEFGSLDDYDDDDEWDSDLDDFDDDEDWDDEEDDYWNDDDLAALPYVERDDGPSALDDAMIEDGEHRADIDTDTFPF